MLLDPALHDGMLHPPLPPPTTSHLRYLLSGPHAQPVVAALPLSDLPTNGLTRMIKLLLREGYSLHGLKTAVLSTRAAEALDARGAAGSACMLLSAARSAGPMGLRRLQLIQQQPQQGAGLGAAAASGAGVLAAESWSGNQVVLQEGWPVSLLQVGQCPSVALMCFSCTYAS